jgi:hypothetical protein
MASNYTISGGTARVDLTSSSSDTYVAIQVTSDSALDADITVLLQHSSDGINFENLGTATTISSGVDGVLLETYDYTLNNLYLYIDVLTATLGTLNFFQSTKKKVNSGEVDATITGDITVDGNTEIIANQDLLLSYNRDLSEIKELIKITNIHLSFITGSDIN